MTSTSYSSWAVPRYSHGAPLATITEEEEPEMNLLYKSSTPAIRTDYSKLLPVYAETPLQTSEPLCRTSPPTFQGFPVEVLSAVFKNLQDRQLTPTRQSLYEGAIALLRTSHVSSYFRQVVLHDPSLWSAVPFLNDFPFEFLDAAMTRSKPLPLQLHVMLDDTISGEESVWDLVAQNANRVSQLLVEIEDAYRGARLKHLLLSSARSLVQCTVHFLGDEMLYLNFLERPGVQLFNGDSPKLRTLRLINCFIPSSDYTLPTLSGVSIQHTGTPWNDGVPPTNVQRFDAPGNSFTFLRSLTLIHCVQCMVPRGPVPFPSLQRLVLVATPVDCWQLSRTLELPPACSRDITVGFRSLQPLSLEHAAAVAECIRGFVPCEMGYTHCAVDMNDTCPSLSLSTKESGKPADVTVRFDLLELDVQLGGVLVVLLKMFTSSTLPNHTIADADPFLYRLWEELALVLRSPLVEPSILDLEFAQGSSAPHFLAALVKAMPNLRELTTRTPDVWANPRLRHLLKRRNAPALKKLTIPYENVTDLAVDELTQFLKSRPDVDQVSFQVHSPTVMSMGYAAEGDISSTIRVIADNFPDTVALEWVAR
ncbi:hypothetical protein D9611_008262 [Ephemerocybe angulata]|uniref:F-box domain-containing protein n=1 Tax=Ephemerocybe angulata TaxID=980116 RepID=A0A8H5BIX0_9AGAR|nr:hypothetical protein D9611_008262 [Tulosesus angulatus]